VQRPAPGLRLSQCELPPLQVLEDRYDRGHSKRMKTVVNASQLLTLDRRRLIRHVGNMPSVKIRELDDGLRLVLAL
jgi:mRNA-degrading endonuclease toxin of MazEF toxin-antitoxin module